MALLLELSSPLVASWNARSLFFGSQPTSNHILVPYLQAVNCCLEPSNNLEFRDFVQITNSDIFRVGGHDGRDPARGPGGKLPRPRLNVPAETGPARAADSAKMRVSRSDVLLGCVLLCSASLLYLGLSGLDCPPESPRSRWAELRRASADPNASLSERLPEDTPLIFIGGFPRSGTTLMRVMLDAHRAVRCGEETRVIPRLLTMRASWSRSVKERIRLDEAGVTDRVLDSAVRAFLLEVIVGHGEPAPRLCNKDPFALKSLTYLAHIFPKSKFVLMVRDGRASIHSVISRKVTISGFDLNNPRDCLTKWSNAVETMFNQCVAAGPDRCLPVRYEHLVLQPEREMRKLLRFLELQWDAAVLHHEELIGKAGGVSLSKVERSTDQVVKPVNTDALDKWVGRIPEDVVEHMAEVAPMLARLGYDPRANPPDYARAPPLAKPALPWKGAEPSGPA